jgi:uncharacterized protein (TIGR00255 family)
MLQSMTGFGKSEVSFGKKSFTILLKSVNSKNADLNIKLPGIYREKEHDIRSLLQREVQRGKVDLFITSESLMNDQVNTINRSIFQAYFNDLKKLAEDTSVSEDVLFTISSRMPNVLSQEKEELDENEWKAIEKGISEAIQSFIDFRNKEGAVLEKDLSARVYKILSLLEDIIPFEKERIETIKSKLESQLEKMVSAEQINRDRFEQELIYYFEKLDITEEKVRLTAHCNLFIETMHENESQGRKLGFISQEIGREINTIGSKANHAGMQQIIVEMKDELEKIKEQLFNIL